MSCMTWWRHQMETFSALLAICAGNSPVPVNSPHKGQWRGALMFNLICVCINGWVNHREAGDLRRYRAHYDVTVMIMLCGHGYLTYIEEIMLVFFRHTIVYFFKPPTLLAMANYVCILFCAWSMFSLKPSRLSDVHKHLITMTSCWARWRLKSPAYRLCTQHKERVTRKMFPFDDAVISKLAHHWFRWWFAACTAPIHFWTNACHFGPLRANTPFMEEY